ncbi:MAG: hypothetical protein Q9217_000634 [Psora testacea]
MDPQPQGDVQSPTPSSPQSSILSIPFEVRAQIFRHIAISPLTRSFDSTISSCARAFVVDAHLTRIGYFPHGTIIPLLLTCRIIHDEVAAILYGENVFGFHVSGLGIERWTKPYQIKVWETENYAFGFSVFARRYYPLIQKVWVRTGYSVEDWGGRNWAEGVSMHRQYQYSIDHTIAPAHEKGTQDDVRIKKAHDLAASVALMKWWWPVEKYGIYINTTDVVTMKYGIFDEGVEAKQRWKDWKKVDWPASGGELWKLVVIEQDSGEIRREFRRVVWERKNNKGIETAEEVNYKHH